MSLEYRWCFFVFFFGAEQEESRVQRREDQIKDEMNAEAFLKMQKISATTLFVCMCVDARSGETEKMEGMQIVLCCLVFADLHHKF